MKDKKDKMIISTLFGIIFGYVLGVIICILKGPDDCNPLVIEDEDGEIKVVDGDLWEG